MYEHHQNSIKNVITYFEPQQEIQGLLLGGSIAHGFANPDSDIDLMIIVSDDAYEARLKKGHLQFFNKDLCTYESGYVDGKYLGISFLQEVNDKGSEPARYAFQDARILLSRLDNLEEIVQAIAQYPPDQKAERIRRFYAQFEAWHWYTGQGLKLQNPYLLNVAINKMILFGGRLVLAHNALLYPYHKWFLRILEMAKEKPAGFLNSIERLYQHPNKANITFFYEAIKAFYPYETPENNWPHQFMIDSEFNWQSGFPPIDDI